MIDGDEEMNCILAKNLSVSFSSYFSIKDRLKDCLSFSTSLKKRSTFWALEDITFAVRRGEVLGVIGHNGSGKTTLLRALSGIYAPDRGYLMVKGKASPVLSIGMGFRLDLSGRDNIYYNAMLLGLSKKDVDEKIEGIIEFSELRSFIDQPLRHYSSGMNARLGFSIAVNLDPDILLIDEVLSVGDLAFSKRALAKMHEMMKKANAIVVSTHDLNFVKEMCNIVIWLNKGRIQMQGDPEKVVAAYDWFSRMGEIKVCA